MDQERTYKMISSMSITFLCTFQYLWGVVMAARVSVFWEIVICVLLPLSGFLFRWERWTSRRQRELIMLEGMYNVFVIITKLLILYNNSQGSEIMSYFFVFFFVLQVAGFVHHQVENRLWVGCMMSITMAASIAIQRWEMREYGYNPQTANLYCKTEVLKTLSKEAKDVYTTNCRGDFSGKFLMWGQDAGPMMKLNYLFWGTNVLMVDYAKFLPFLIIPVVHYASIAISFWSEEFWHVRLLTASHLFVLDGIALYKFGVIAKDWCHMDGWMVPKWRDYVVPTIALVSLILCIMCPIVGGICGQQSLFCVDELNGNFTGFGTNYTNYRNIRNSSYIF